jgi:hypothetical protein
VLQPSPLKEILSWDYNRREFKKRQKASLACLRKER